VALSNEQVDALLAPLDPRRVKQAQGNSHLEAWDVRRHLLRVFGWGGWSFRVLSCDCILERSTWDEGSTHKGRHTVAYRVLGALDIYDGDRVIATFEDGATGDAQNQPSFADAHDMALKTAMSQALKRCAVNLGDRFGLSLYNNGAVVAVVGKSLAHTDAAAREASEHVEGGELVAPPKEEDPPASKAEEIARRQHDRARQVLAESDVKAKAANDA
jgi:recombination DNA repair RAD52 pathway protein